MVKISKSGFFLGEFKHRLDERHRIALPKRIRVEIDGYEVVLSRGFEPCIAGFDIQKWQEMAKQELTLPYHDSQARSLRRQVFSGAMIVELDSQGRVVLPESLLIWSELKDTSGEAVIIGVGDHFEIWSQANYSKLK